MENEIKQMDFKHKIKIDMKYLAIILAVVVSTTAFEASAQDYLFRVLANKGTNQVKKGATAASQLKTGSKLYSGDQIIAANGAYIGLVHKTGKTLEIRTAGTHSVDDLVGKVSKGTASVTGRYMNFVMNKMNEADGDVNRNYRRNLNATGAVERATGYTLALLLKDSQSPNKVYGDMATIRWEGGAEDDTYKVTVKNAFSEVLYEAESAENKLNLDFTSDKLQKERFLIVSVKSATDESVKSKDYGIQRLSPNEASELKGTLAQLEQDMTEGSLMNDLVYASFYEENRLYLDALTSYEAALKANPDVEDFKTIYEQFVIGNGLGN